MSNCANCGSQNPDGVKFCNRCGTPMSVASPPAAPFPVEAPRIPLAHPRRHGQTAGVVAIIAAGLSVILLFEFLIGPLISGRTLLGKPFRPGQNAAAATAVVIPEAAVTEINGVRIDFGDNLSAEVEISLSRSSEAPENDLYSGIDTYDFALEGQNEFDGLIELTIPNTATADEAVQVAYYNEDLAIWEKLPFELVGNQVRFYTTHFSRYGLIKYHRDRYTGPLTPLVVNYEQLRLALAKIEADGLLEQFIEQKGQTGSDPWINKGMAVFNDTVGGVSLPFTAVALSSVQDETTAAARELSDKLTKVGGAITFLKVAYQWQTGDAPAKIVQDNIFDLCELALGGAALAIPGSVILPVAGMFVFLGGAFYDYAYVPVNQDDSLQYAYKAYSDFCKLPYIAYDKNLAQALAENTSEVSPWVIGQNYNKKTKKWVSAQSGPALASLELSSNNKWRKALMDIYTLYLKDPRAMQERVTQLIDEYLEVFWTLDDREQLQFAADFSGIKEEDWRWPTENEISQMKEAMKAELMEELKPVFEDIRNTILEDMKKNLIRDTDALVEYLNQEISFEVIDPEAKEPGFKNTRVAQDIIRFETVSNMTHQNDWLGQAGKGPGDAIFAATLYNYLREGSPGEACFYKTEADLKAGQAYLKAPISITLPRATINLGQEADMTGKYTLDLSLFKGPWQSDATLVRVLADMLHQVKDLEVKKDGSFSVTAPAQSLNLKTLATGSKTDTEVTFGSISFIGQIDPKTGSGRAEFSGSANGSWAAPDTTEYNVMISGSFTVGYEGDLKGLIFSSSPESTEFLQLTGTDVWTISGEKFETQVLDEKIRFSCHFIRP